MIQVVTYMNLQMDTVIPTKVVKIFPNNKPWVTKSLKGILNKKKRVFYRGTTTEKKQINMEVKNAIRQAKKQYKNKIESKFIAGNFRSAWQGIKNMAAVNKMSDSNELKVKLGNKSDQIIADDMNAFFTRFEKHDFSPEITALKKSLVPSESVIVDADTVVKQLMYGKVLARTVFVVKLYVFVPISLVAYFNTCSSFHLICVVYPNYGKHPLLFLCQK